MTHQTALPWAGDAVEPACPTALHSAPLWQDHPLFEGLTEAELTLVTRYFTAETLSAGEVLQAMDRSHGHIGIVLEGALREDANSNASETNLLGLVFAGGLLCPTGPRLPRFAETALCDTEAWICAADEFPALAGQIPRLALNLVTETQRRLNEAIALYQLRGCMTAMERVAELISVFSSRQGHPETVSLFLSRQDLGALAALTSETVSRQIKTLERDGILSLASPSRIAIRDHARLRAATGVGAFTALVA
ncbi:Crp/Fnr family transcriptional regulator [Tritonibacter mobilis]|uniref:Crp/Fnr family transcriptional regulator n=1 Tax=Tritonibacter mobilis TaxID=379347 RepID=UPI000806A0A0|nr:Crp/Fnr family transcriptional regulator [Tritonibacter mobilis]